MSHVCVNCGKVAVHPIVYQRVYYCSTECLPLADMQGVFTTEEPIPVVQFGQLEADPQNVFMSKVDDPVNFDYRDEILVVGSESRVHLLASVNGKVHICHPNGEWEPPLPGQDDPQPDHIIKAE